MPSLLTPEKPKISLEDVASKILGLTPMHIEEMRQRGVLVAVKRIAATCAKLNLRIRQTVDFFESTRDVLLSREARRMRRVFNLYLKRLAEMLKDRQLHTNVTRDTAITQERELTRFYNVLTNIITLVYHYYAAYLSRQRKLPKGFPRRLKKKETDIPLIKLVNELFTVSSPDVIQTWAMAKHHVQYKIERALDSVTTALYEGVATLANPKVEVGEDVKIEVQAGRADLKDFCALALGILDGDDLKLKDGDTLTVPKVFRRSVDPGYR